MVKYSSIVIAAAWAQPTLSFVMPQKAITHNTVGTSALSIAAESYASLTTSRTTQTSRPHGTASTVLFMSTTTESTLSLTLEKPLGLILEESEDGSGGVIVTQVNEGGSAFESPSAEQLILSKISTVMEQDVSSLSFDDVMDAIINAPSPFGIEFALPSVAVAETETTAEVEAEVVPTTPSYEVGTTVTITVQQPETNKPEITLNGKVGDNLRKTLLANKDIELYRGLKKKLGNCGGGGQCGFCAVELIDDGEGVWGDRSDYEAQRIGRNGNEKCRLACMNNIVGPATVRTL